MMDQLRDTEYRGKVIVLRQIGKVKTTHTNAPKPKASKTIRKRK